MVHASVLMKELWPNARFIFIKRRVIENVLSRQRKFPEDTTERHYSDWTAVMTAWLAVHGMLAAAALEIEHRQLVPEPDAAACDPIMCALGYSYDESYFVTEVGPPAVITVDLCGGSANGTGSAAISLLVIAAGVKFCPVIAYL
jgi:hypothetical protein